MTAPILLKSAGSVYRTGNNWHDAKVKLQEIGNVTLHRCKLVAQGCGSFALI